MAKMWAGRTSGETCKIADDFNSSISFDKKMYKEDVCGSMAHASMLASKGIISEEDSQLIIRGLTEIFSDIESGKLEISSDAEDIHMFIEAS